ncbi:MAG: glutathione S-transferase family protein [Gammaproteobacteria bacterium]|nr:glutathione S-transferase family protein [Gammaproteobacteria bacterium]MBQ0840976.1 glutathione S-transferase family protein [Gammaproteobacteria bacterium]
MFKLYGFPVSNYYNMVKLTLLEKGFEFEEVITRPSQEDDYLNKSPMGKIPCLEVKEGPISETNVIFDFLEDLSPDVPLYPADPYERAKVRELSKSIELYLELVTRQLLGVVFFGAPADEQLNATVNTQLDKGVNALNRILIFSPFAAGEVMTYADFMLYYTVTLGNMATKKALGRDLCDEMPGLAGWLAIMDKNPLVQKVNADRDEALKAMAG